MCKTSLLFGWNDMEHEKVCFFIGHREASERILPVLTQAVEQLIVESGVTDFVVGHYGSFDSLAAKVVKAAKKRHPDVTLTMLLPYGQYILGKPANGLGNRAIYQPAAP